MPEIHLDHPHHATAGYVGEPGSRTFFVQVEDAHQRITLVAEKAQVAGIADLLAQLLARIGDQPAEDWDRAAMDLREPVEGAWRIGEIAVGLDADLGRFIIEFGELVLGELVDDGEDDDADDDPDDDPADDDIDEREMVRFTIDQDQARRLAAHCAEVVGQGRPRCQLCGRPMAPDRSHVCPATNGHGTLSPR